MPALRDALASLYAERWQIAGELVALGLFLTGVALYAKAVA